MASFFAVGSIDFARFEAIVVSGSMSLCVSGVADSRSRFLLFFLPAIFFFAPANDDVTSIERCCSLSLLRLPLDVPGYESTVLGMLAKFNFPTLL